MESKSVINYESPLLRVVEIDPEGVLCGSNEAVDTNDGIW
jgi:hypothetical protein